MRSVINKGKEESNMGGTLICLVLRTIGGVIYLGYLVSNFLRPVGRQFAFGVVAGVTVTCLVTGTGPIMGLYLFLGIVLPAALVLRLSLELTRRYRYTRFDVLTKLRGDRV